MDDPMSNTVVAAAGVAYSSRYCYVYCPTLSEHILHPNPKPMYQNFPFERSKVNGEKCRRILETFICRVDLASVYMNN